MKKRIIRFALYIFTALVLYGVMVGGFFRGGFQPLLLIPLCTAVASRENEFFALGFGAFCGFALDIAESVLPGMSAIWLAPCCY
ncbi:MAG: hypothetical protein LBN42_03625, partial [Oscillospiraceae bacterium]|nr:hypothetical protein [Oscillospiraceae bacterium]